MGIFGSVFFVFIERKLYWNLYKKSLRFKAPFVGRLNVGSCPMTKSLI